MIWDAGNYLSETTVSLRAALTDKAVGSGLAMALLRLFTTKTVAKIAMMASMALMRKQTGRWFLFMAMCIATEMPTQKKGL